MDAYNEIRSSYQSEVWGVLGGMGPLASAEFLNTIYEQHAGLVEQDLPIVILLSDPTIPDRTQCFLSGKEQILMERFTASIDQLLSAGVTKVIVCCLTIHRLIPRLPVALREKIISLVDIILEDVLQSSREHLLVCTEGTKRMELFQNHELWHKAKSQIIFPTQEDQSKIHSLIYEIKSNHRDAKQLEFLQSLLQRYEVNSYIAGCTELHILAKEQERVTGLDRSMFCIDPLTIVASMVSRTSQGRAFGEPGKKTFSTI